MDFQEQQQFQPDQQTPEQEFFQRRHYVAITVLFVLLASLLTFLITYIVLTSFHQKDKEIVKEQVIVQMNQQLEGYEEFKTVLELYNSLPKELRNIQMYEKLAELDLYYRTFYAGKIDEEKLVYMVANGYIVGAGDTFGAFYSADEFKAVIDDVGGSAVGIGVYVTQDTSTSGIRISYVMKDGPANKAGLLPGDVVTHVGGEAVSDIGYYTAINRIKGEVGTEVEITFIRDGESYTKTLIREKINVESVIYTKHETQPDVGIIRVIEFNNTTSAQFIAAVKQAVEVDGVSTLVYDLRGNPGGTLVSVVEMLDFLLPSGKIVTVRYAGGEDYVYYSDSEGEEFSSLGKDVKMAILVNGATASAAELFTSAMGDYGMATIVGTKTYGKGCGQSVIPLDDGTGLAFTTFMYDPPVRENYNGVGITPDVVQEMSEEASKKNIFELSHDEDDQLKAALEVLK